MWEIYTAALNKTAIFNDIGRNIFHMESPRAPLCDVCQSMVYVVHVATNEIRHKLPILCVDEGATASYRS